MTDQNPVDSHIEGFLRDVDNICRRPGMYTLRASLLEVCSYICGYAHGSPNCPISSGEAWSAFNKVVCATYRYPDKYAWPAVLVQCSANDTEGIERLRVLLTEFVTKTKTQSLVDIVNEAVLRTASAEEGEPEKAWRKFFRALLTGCKEDIEPLIQEHPDAAILWEGGEYPADVAASLNQIADSYPVTQIPGSGDDSRIMVITPDFGPVAIQLIDGIWKVDVTKIIAIRKWKRNEEVRSENKQ